MYKILSEIVYYFKAKPQSNIYKGYTDNYCIRLPFNEELKKDLNLRSKISVN